MVEAPWLVLVGVVQTDERLILRMTLSTDQQSRQVVYVTSARSAAGVLHGWIDDYLAEGPGRQRDNESRDEGDM